MLYITHDLLSARLLSDEILVLAQGSVVEQGPAKQIIRQPTDEYTRRLLKAIPKIERPTGVRAGDVPADEGQRGLGHAVIRRDSRLLASAYVHSELARGCGGGANAPAILFWPVTATFAAVTGQKQKVRAGLPPSHSHRQRPLQ
jgi:ABC-type glutathione transport system ATPase component